MAINASQTYDFTTSYYIPVCAAQTLTLQSHKKTAEDPTDRVITAIEQCIALCETSCTILQARQLEEFTRIFTEHIKQHNTSKSLPTLLSHFRISHTPLQRLDGLVQKCTQLVTSVQTTYRRVLEHSYNDPDLSYKNLLSIASLRHDMLSTDLFHLNTQHTASIARIEQEIQTDNSQECKDWIFLGLQLDPSMTWLRSYINTNIKIAKLEFIYGMLTSLSTSQTLFQETEVSCRIFSKAHLFLLRNCKTLNDAQNFAASWLFFDLQNPLFAFDEFHQELQKFLPQFLPQQSLDLILSFIVECTNQSDTPPTAFSHILKALIRNETPDCDWIEMLLQKNPSETLIQKLIQIQHYKQDTLNSLSCQTLLRYKQITVFETTHKCLDTVQQYELAHRIEKTICKVNLFESRYFKKSTPKKTSRSVIRREDGTLFLPLKSRPKLLESFGSSKKVTQAIMLNKDSRIQFQFVAQAVNRTWLHTWLRTRLPIDTEQLRLSTDEEYASIAREANIHAHFSGQRGIWPLLDMCAYTKKIQGENHTHLVKKMSLITPLADGSFKDIYENRFTPTTEQLLTLFYELAQGVQAMHRQNFIHGDLAEANIVYSKKPLKCGLIDFAISGIATKNPYTITQLGLYGSITPTPPEIWHVLTTKDFKGDLFKVEIWALGIIFYHCLLQAPLSWEEKLLRAYGKEESFHIDTFYTHISHDITLPATALQTQQAHHAYLNTKKSLQLLFFSMLHPQPDQRPTIDRVVEKLKNIMEKTAHE